MATGFTKNFVVKNGITTGPITLDAGTGNITGTNLSVTGLTDLGNVGNITIDGGSSGYVLSTDGSGNLSFIDPTAGASNPAPMPIVIDAGNTLTIGSNYQGLFGYPITIDGTIIVDGVLVDVNDATIPAGNISYVQYNNGNVMGGTASFTFVASTGILSVPKVVASGYVKTVATTYSSLPIAATAGAGARAFITDANSTTFLATVGGGGANAVPVVSNGSTWIVG